MEGLAAENKHRGFGRQAVANQMPYKALEAAFAKPKARELQPVAARCTWQPLWPET